MEKNYWLGANAQRTKAAALGHIAAIKAAMAHLDAANATGRRLRCCAADPRTTQRELEIAQLRLAAPPTTSLRQIAEANGMTKDGYAAVLNRFLRRHRNCRPTRARAA